MKCLAECLAAFFGVLALAHQANAVIVAGTNGSRNTAAPADDPGFANVGVCGSGISMHRVVLRVARYTQQPTSSDLSTKQTDIEAVLVLLQLP